MLLKQSAISEAVQSVTTSDFYKPAHAHIFDAISTLYAAGEPVDPVTVADELSRVRQARSRILLRATGVVTHEIERLQSLRPTAPLGGIEQTDSGKTIAVVDYNGFRIVIPLKEMMVMRTV